MENSQPWPTNKYGNQWRSARLCYDWADEETVYNAFDEIDPYKIIIRPSHAVAAIAFRNVSEAVMARLKTSGSWSGGGWNADKLRAIIDPCRDPDAMTAEVESWWWPVQFSIFGASALHFADEHTYRHLKGVFNERRDLLTGRMPVIGF